MGVSTPRVFLTLHCMMRIHQFNFLSTCCCHLSGVLITGWEVSPKWSSITIATNDCAHIVSGLCCGAPEEARAGLYLGVLVFTAHWCVMKCYTCFHLRGGCSWPRLSTRAQFTKRKSQFSVKQDTCLNQWIKHLPGKRNNNRLMLLT